VPHDDCTNRLYTHTSLYTTHYYYTPSSSIVLLVRCVCKLDVFTAYLLCCFSANKPEIDMIILIPSVIDVVRWLFFCFLPLTTSRSSRLSVIKFDCRLFPKKRAPICSRWFIISAWKRHAIPDHSCSCCCRHTILKWRGTRVVKRLLMVTLSISPFFPLEMKRPLRNHTAAAAAAEEVEA
jgi:hypothetical protein